MSLWGRFLRIFKKTVPEPKPQTNTSNVYNVEGYTVGYANREDVQDYVQYNAMCAAALSIYAHSTYRSGFLSQTVAWDMFRKSCYHMNLLKEIEPEVHADLYIKLGKKRTAMLKGIPEDHKAYKSLASLDRKSYKYPKKTKAEKPVKAKAKTVAKAKEVLDSGPSDSDWLRNRLPPLERKHWNKLYGKYKDKGLTAAEANERANHYTLIKLSKAGRELRPHT